MRESPEIARGETGRKVREEGAKRDKDIAYIRCVRVCVCMEGEDVCICVGRRARVEWKVGRDEKEEWGAY